MKKALLITVALLLTTTAMFANEGKLKAGVALGYPSGLTAGWHPSEKFELNLLLGTDYGGFTVGVTPLFTIADLTISDQNFPLSIGPSVNLSLNSWYTHIDILGVVRMEYSFKDIPLNLYAELGAGVQIVSTSITLFGVTSSASAVGFGFSGAFGIRYVF